MSQLQNDEPYWTSQDSSLEARQTRSHGLKRNISSTDLASQEVQRVRVSTSTSAPTSSSWLPVPRNKNDESWMDDLIDFADHELQTSNLDSTDAAAGEERGVNFLPESISDALDLLPSSSCTAGCESNPGLDSPIRLGTLDYPYFASNTSTHLHQPFLSAPSGLLHAHMRPQSESNLSTVSATTSSNGDDCHFEATAGSCPGHPSRTTAIPNIASRFQPLVNRSISSDESNKYSFTAPRARKEPTLLTLTSFPFRVLHINDAFSQAYGSRNVVGETFYDVFRPEFRQIYTVPTIASSPTLLGTYQNEVVRLLPFDKHPGVLCKIIVHPVYKQGQIELGLRYYAVTIKCIPTESVVASGIKAKCRYPNSTKPPSTIYFPIASQSSSITIKRRRQDGILKRNEQNSKKLFYIS